MSNISQQSTVDLCSAQMADQRHQQQQAQAAVSAVLDVLRRDEQGQSDRCYFPYLACMQQVLAAATASAAAAAATSAPVEQLSQQQLEEQRRLMRLMKLCLERSGELLGKAAAMQQPSSFRPPSQLSLPPQQQPPLPPPPPAHLGPRKSPMQEAMEMNRRLYSAHLARTSSLAPGDPRRVNLHLALQRRIEENLQLAKPKQAAYEQALQDDLLAKRTDCSRLFQLHAGVFNYDDSARLAEDRGIDAAELRTLYCRCSEFDYLVLYRDQLYQKSAGQPAARLQYMLSIPDHPLTAFLAAFSDRLASRLSITTPPGTPPTIDDAADSATVSNESDTESDCGIDVDCDDSTAGAGRLACRLLSRLAPAACLLCGGGSSGSGSLASHEVAACSALLAGRLLNPQLESRALARLAIALRPLIARLAGIVVEYDCSLPNLQPVEQLEVLTKLCAVSDRFANLTVSSSNLLLESRALLRRLCTTPGTPLGKCQLLQDTLNSVLAAMRAGAKFSGEIGADDLVPVLAFVVATAGQPALLCHLKYIEYFLDDSHMLGAEGYCFTSVYTAAMALVSADGSATVGH